ncbi:putative cellulase (glycosyl hydrolase family 5) [Lyophyllum shimeji]|uniref:Cellulase (Glycosyl hydrolase family 5) n=1 Tax=Lyophyllum shimeji TaxID=47721 RepID=A0A9P3PH13_LYOSH|nr:putative cellulase (glycosyl hydrolase family 5) [Lyophyllum shimeji]
MTNTISSILIFLVTLSLLYRSSYAALSDWTPPLSTRGRYVVDKNGVRFKLKAGNWHGASGTYSGSGDINQDSSHHANENAHTLPLGLQYASLNDILDGFEKLRINTIRLPFSNQMIHDTTPVQDSWVAANPQLRGLTPLQVYDAVIKALTDRGFAVILNNHTNKSVWCCAVNDGNERWNESQSDDAWAADWLFMVSRYRSNGRVIGADLYNEVRRDVLNDPNWGVADDHDWYRYSQWLGDRILTEANPDTLIIIEGINWTGVPVDGLPHHRPTLEPVGNLSHTFVVSNKLVYSAHFYAYTGPSHSGATGVGETHDARYRDFSQADLFQVMTDQAGYVAFDTDKHYTAPVWISEFGVEGRGQILDADRTWFNNMITYLTTNDMDFALWPLVGYLGPNNTNGWALLNWNPATGAQDSLYDGNDWRESAWDTLVGFTGGKTGTVSIPMRWQMLNLDYADFVESLVQRSRGDWDSGARKGMCPDGLRLIGISAGSTRALCTNSASYSWASGNPTTTVFDERYVSSADWATGYTKYQCPSGSYVVGYAIRGSKVSTVLCAQASKPLGTGGSGTKWFDQGDNVPAAGVGGDFHSGQYKGVCETDEYMAGIAFTTRIGSNGAPAAILCWK